MKENDMETLRYCKIRKVKSPVRGTPVAGGIDFFVPEDIDVDTFADKCKTTGCYPSYTLDDDYKIKTIELKPGESVMIPSGIKMKVMDGHALVFMNKSGIGAKKQLDVLACLVDEDYRGEVHINLVNNGWRSQTIAAGDKIVQGVILKMNYASPEEVANEDVLYADSTSERGEGGFGSTGTK